MIYTLPYIIREISFGTGQSVGTLSMDRVVLAMKIDAAQDKITDTILEIRPSLLSTYFDLSLTGVEEYKLTDYITWDYESILRMDDITNSTDPIRTSAFNWGDSAQYYENVIYPAYEPWGVRDNVLTFPEKSSGRTVRVWYTRRPVGLFYGTAAAGAATSVTFPATPTIGELIPETDYYVGMRVCCANQVRTITAYNATTRVATVDSAWTTNPSSSTEVSLVSPLPKRYHPLIVDLAVRRIKVAVDDDDSMIRAAITEDVTLMNSRLSKQQVQTPEYIRKVRM